MNSRSVLQGRIAPAEGMSLLAGASPQETVPTSTSVEEIPVARPALISQKLKFIQVPLLMPASAVSSAFLTFVEIQRNGVDGVEGLSGIVSMIVSPEGKHMYVAGVLSRTVAVFGALSPSLTITSAESSFH
jgi:hypothetical protein